MLEHWFMPMIAPEIQGLPLLPHVWETTLPSSNCDTWFGNTYHQLAKHFKICSKNEGMHQVGSKKS